MVVARGGSRPEPPRRDFFVLIGRRQHIVTYLHTICHQPNKDINVAHLTQTHTTKKESEVRGFLYSPSLYPAVLPRLLDASDTRDRVAIAMPRQTVFRPDLPPRLTVWPLSLCACRVCLARFRVKPHTSGKVGPVVVSMSSVAPDWIVRSMWRSYILPLSVLRLGSNIIGEVFRRELVADVWGKVTSWVKDKVVKTGECVQGGYE